jgi:hypothetical protein
MIPKQLKSVIEDIEKTTIHLPQFKPIQGWVNLPADEALMNELAGQYGAYLIRFILNRAGKKQICAHQVARKFKMINYIIL